MKDYNVNRRDLELYLSEEELTRYKDHKRIEFMLISIIKAVAELEDKASIQLYLINMLDQNSHELDELEHTVVANREWERQIMLGEQIDDLVEGMLDD